MNSPVSPPFATPEEQTAPAGEHVAEADTRRSTMPGILTRARRALGRYGYDRVLLRTIPPREPAAAAVDVRWVDASLAGRCMPAFSMRPGDSAVRFRFLPAPGARFAAWFAVSTEDGGAAGDVVRIGVSAESSDGRRAQVHDTVRVGTSPKWRRVTLPLPASEGELALTLETQADSALPRHTVVWWGEPCIERRRTLSELWRLTSHLVRTQGLAGAWHRFHDTGTEPHRDQARYARWARTHTPGPADLEAMRLTCVNLSYAPLVSVITPVHETHPAWLRACIESVRGQAYPCWELCICDDGSTSEATRAVIEEVRTDPRVKIARHPERRGISEASNTAISLASGEFLAFLDHDDELAPEALYEVARTLNEFPDADFIYSDEDKLDAAGQRTEPAFKPGWSPEHMRAAMYTCHLMVLRRSVVEAIGGFRAGFEGAQDYDLVLRVWEATDRIRHIPKVLYHWRKIPGSTSASLHAKSASLGAQRRSLQAHADRLGVVAQVEEGRVDGQWRVRFMPRAGEPTVSLIVLTPGRVQAFGARRVNVLLDFLRSVSAKTTYRHLEVLVVDDGELPADTTSFVERARYRRLTYDRHGPFNFAHKLNFAVAASTGEHLLLCNDDLEVISPDWIEAMLEYSRQPEIGAVGARLLYPDGRIQHVGMLLGVRGVAAHAFHQAPAGSLGYFASTVSVRNYSAVTAACMMTRRDVFDGVGGFDERFAIDFNDVDYCLRLRASGYRIVFTPFAELYHREASSIGLRAHDASALKLMRERWDAVLRHDPYYNPNLSRDFPDYRLPV